ncbi:glycosyltransferase family 2 protein [Marinilabiliaceae bacterium ANBcel2]|nr:glycosyltransferase family 2 protein [Marinilabiliaceae bacterium ANBcel2]
MSNTIAAEKPKVSIIIPVRNEERYIVSFLETLFNQDYPHDKIEVIIADGMSNDSTRYRIEHFLNGKNSVKVKVIDNPGQIVPEGLNRALAMCGNEIIIRMDAHAFFPANYISRLVDEMDKYNADNIGGVIRTLPSSNSLFSKAIAAAMSSAFGMGNSRFRVGTTRVCRVDTVPFGCFKADVFEKAGGFDEELVRNQDDEFNGRITKKGFNVVLLPDLVIDYYARDSIKKTALMFFQYGLFKPLCVKKLKRIATFRQLVPPLFVFSILISLLVIFFIPQFIILFISVFGLYFFVSVAISILLSQKDKSSLVNRIKLLCALVVTFFVIHFSYGLGYLQGIISLVFNRKRLFATKSVNR